MKVALISKLWEDASPTSTGGTGHMVGLIADGLVDRGHEVTVFAPASSKTRACVHSVIDKPLSQWNESLHYLNLIEAFKRQDEFDLINCWVDHTACFFAPLVKSPTLITVDYGDISSSQKEVYQRSKELNFSTVSYAMQALLSFLSWQGMVYHGVDLDRFSFNDRPKDYLLFLGRLSPQKGPHLAIEVAKRTKSRLILAGKPDYEPYLKELVWPQVNGDQIQHCPFQSFAERVELYRHARALINPLTYFEAFGLTMVEAMACGTPVVAYANGAVPEVVGDGETGFIIEPDLKHRFDPRPNEIREVYPELPRSNLSHGYLIDKEGVEGLISGVKQIDRIDRSACRRWAEKFFDAERMIDEYEKLYREVVGDG